MRKMFVLLALVLAFVACKWDFWNPNSPDFVEADDVYFIGTVQSESGASIGEGQVVIEYPEKQLTILADVTTVGPSEWQFTFRSPYKPQTDTVAAETLQIIRAVPKVQPQPDLGVWQNPVFYKFAEMQYRVNLFVR